MEIIVYIMLGIQRGQHVHAVGFLAISIAYEINRTFPNDTPSKFFSKLGTFWALWRIPNSYFLIQNAEKGSISLMDYKTTAHDASSLCQQCGLCCTGLLFEYVSFGEHELKNVEVGALKIKEPGKKALPHPCQFLDATSCGIYIDRPSRCRRFACISRQHVLNGEKTLDEGRVIVAEIHRLLALLSSIGDETPEFDYRTVGFRKFCEKFAKSVDKKLEKGTTPTETEQKLVSVCFDIIKIIDRHFRKTSRLNKYAQLVTGIDYLVESTKQP